MRIMTYAVRQALAANTPETNGDNPSSDDYASSDESLSDKNLIPCAGPPAERLLLPTDSSVTQADEDVHRDKRFRKTSEVRQNAGKPQEPKVDMDYCDRDSLQGDMVKFWHQRNQLFWRFGEGIKLDAESWYSVTPEAIARQIAERCRSQELLIFPYIAMGTAARCATIVDAFCGAGGNAIQFASTCSKVIAIDIDPNKIHLAKHNANIYGVADKIEFICTDFVRWIQAQEEGSVDVIFLSPPWGGIEYLSFNLHTKSSESSGYYPLTELKPLAGKDLFTLARRVTREIAFYLPRNVDMKQVSDLVEKNVRVEVEEAWMTSKCKAVTVYFGSLAVDTAS